MKFDVRHAAMGEDAVRAEIEAAALTAMAGKM